LLHRFWPVFGFLLPRQSLASKLPHIVGFFSMALALTHEQTELVHRGAAAVPPRWRERYIGAVADILTLCPNPTNEQVLQAVAAARRAMALGTGPARVD
jgi:hypothetical protein